MHLNPDAMDDFNKSAYNGTAMSAAAQQQMEINPHIVLSTSRPLFTFHVLWLSFAPGLLIHSHPRKNPPEQQQQHPSSSQVRSSQPATHPPQLLSLSIIIVSRKEEGCGTMGRNNMKRWAITSPEICSLGERVFVVLFILWGRAGKWIINPRANKYNCLILTNPSSSSFLLDVVLIRISS